MYKQDLALNNLLGLINHENPTNINCVQNNLLIQK